VKAKERDSELKLKGTQVGECYFYNGKDI